MGTPNDLSEERTSSRWSVLIYQAALLGAVAWIVLGLPEPVPVQPELEPREEDRGAQDDEKEPVSATTLTLASKKEQRPARGQRPARKAQLLGELPEDVIEQRGRRAFKAPCCRKAEFEPLAFVKEHWLSHADEDPDRIRFRMMGDLLISGELVGMHADDVQELLGPLERVLLHTSARGETFVRYVYPVEGQPRFDTRGLVLVMDEDDVVREISTDGPAREQPYLTSGACPRHEW